MRDADEPKVLGEGSCVALLALLTAPIRAIRLHCGVVAARLAVPFGPAWIRLAELPDPLTGPHAAQVEYLAQPRVIEPPLPQENRSKERQTLLIYLSANHITIIRMLRFLVAYDVS